MCRAILSLLINALLVFIHLFMLGIFAGRGSLKSLHYPIMWSISKEKLKLDERYTYLEV